MCLRNMTSTLGLHKGAGLVKMVRYWSRTVLKCLDCNNCKGIKSKKNISFHNSRISSSFCFVMQELSSTSHTEDDYTE